jgi:hypothetical protein
MNRFVESAFTQPIVEGITLVLDAALRLLTAQSLWVHAMDALANALQHTQWHLARVDSAAGGGQSITEL